MQDSLLSRFDLIFVVLDEMDPDHDRRWAVHTHSHTVNFEGQSFCSVQETLHVF